MHILSRFNNILNSIMTVIVMVLACTLTLTVGTQVFFRYVIQSSLIWSDEVSRYHLIWITFLGSSVALKKGSHITVSLLLDFCNKRHFSLIAILSYLVSVLTLSVITYYGFVMASRNMHQLSVVTRVPIGIVYLCIPIGGLFMILQIIESGWNLFRKNNVIKKEIMRPSE